MAITQLRTFEILPPLTSASLTSPPLNHLVASLCARQSLYSGYPVNLYTDLRSSRVFHLVSGWTCSSAISSWQKDAEDVNTVYGGMSERAQEFFKCRESVYLDMDFDRIPRGVKGSGRVLCMVKNHIGRESDEDGDGRDDGDMTGGGIQISQGGLRISGDTAKIDDQSSFYRPSEPQSDDDDSDFDSDDSDNEETCQIEWIGGGHDIRDWERPEDGSTREAFYSFIMYTEGASERALKEKLGGRIRSRDFTAMRRLSTPGPVTVPTVAVK